MCWKLMWVISVGKGILSCSTPQVSKRAGLQLDFQPFSTHFGGFCLVPHRTSLLQEFSCWLRSLAMGPAHVSHEKKEKVRFLNDKSGANGLQDGVQPSPFETSLHKGQEGGGSMSVLGASLLLAGGTVGAGIIALPVETHEAGFVPTMVGLVGCWALLYVSALFLFELSLWYGVGANLTTMAEATLGVIGKLICVALYLFVYGATIVAYIAEAPDFIVPALSAVTGLSVPSWLASAVFTLFGGYIVYRGAKSVDRMNTICMAGCIMAYSLLLVLGFKRVKADPLLHTDWPETVTNLPVMVVALSFHNMIPSLLGAMKSPDEVRKAIFWGSISPLVMYMFWEGLILGSLKEGEKVGSVSAVVQGMRESAGELVVDSLEVFSFLAIVTSFLGVGLGCLDFVTDFLLGFEIDAFSNVLGKESNGKLQKDKLRLVAILAFLLPSYLIGVNFPYIFLSALEFSGTLRLVLFSLMPVAMVWVGRYKQQKEEKTRGGKLLLMSVLFTAVLVIAIEWRHKLFNSTPGET